VVIAMSPSLNDVLAATIPAALFAAAILFGRSVERRRPIEPKQSRSDIVTDYKLAAINMLMNGVLAFLPIAALQVAGGRGLIALPLRGWGVVGTFAVYVLTFDLLLYLFHRAQHKVPALWAMHSLHHSANAMTVSTSARHYWLEGVVKRLWLAPLPALLFAVPPTVPAIATLLYLLVDSCAHMNVQLSLGRCALWINNPQYHRIHHSLRPEHVDRNFSDLLPLWDVLFGTAHRPALNEWPPTGLDTREKASGVIEGLIWPARHWLRPHLPADAE
jgi:sterol desaturase/sphingolipid hydroxylase (fatty acid hydroxylase superfamily)